MNGPSHIKLVTLAFQALRRMPAGARREFEAAMRETCMLPDVHAIPILEGRRGAWRRYLPPRIQPFNFQISDRSPRAYLPPLGFFIRKVVACIRSADVAEAGRYAGVFSHYLGDFAEPAHYYELDVGRLAPPPAHMKNCNYHMMLEGIGSGLRRVKHRPALLGASGGELEFRLGGRFAALRAESVAAVLPMLRSIYRRRSARASKVFDGVMASASRVLADFCHSCWCVGAKEYDEGELDALRACDLRDVLPQDYDVEFNFSQVPLVDVITLEPYGCSEPFRLYSRRGRRKAARAVGGICTIPHALPLKGTTPSATLVYRLPRGTYSEFRATAGLLAGPERQAKCRFEVRADDRRLYRSRWMRPGDLAEPVEVDVTRCKLLALKVHTDGSTDRLAYPIWGEPVLRKP